MMPVTDLDVAERCLGIYGHPDTPPVPWDFRHPEAEGVSYGIARVGDTDLLIFEGTSDQIGWYFNFVALPHNPIDHPDFGAIHPGFFERLEDAWADIKPRLGPRVIVGGHSRGGAQVRLMTALMIADGRPPQRTVIFGSPRAGFAKLADYCRMVPEHSYMNCDPHHHDQVTDVPFYVPALGWLYVHRGQPLRVTQVPPPNHPWGWLAWHDMRLYVAALQAAALALV